MLSPGENAIPDLIYRTSYVLRCWINEEKQVRLLLVDVHSGKSIPLADLAELPAVLKTMLADCLATGSELELPTNALIGNLVNRQQGDQS